MLTRIRRTILCVALLACGVDAISGVVGDQPIEPPAAEAAAAQPVRKVAPDPPFRAPMPTYAPIARVSPIVTSAPTTPAVSVPVTPPSSIPTTPSTTSASSTASDVEVAVAVPPAHVARVLGATISVWNDRADRSPSTAFSNVTEFGNPRVFLATALAGDWVQILMPTRPNGSTGWVRATDVDVTMVDDRIDVDLAARTLTWTRAGQLVLMTIAAVGSPSTPTPTGTFFVTDVLPFDPAAGRGPWVVALNGHSDAYTTFEGGDPRLAIHGTNAPSSLGAAVSNGCVRIGAEPLEQLRAGVPLGTPVVVR